MEGLLERKHSYIVCFSRNNALNLGEKMMYFSYPPCDTEIIEWIAANYVACYNQDSNGLANRNNHSLAANAITLLYSRSRW